MPRTVLCPQPQYWVFKRCHRRPHLEPDACLCWAAVCSGNSPTAWWCFSCPSSLQAPVSPALSPSLSLPFTALFVSVLCPWLSSLSSSLWSPSVSRGLLHTRLWTEPSFRQSTGCAWCPPGAWQVLHQLLPGGLCQGWHGAPGPSGPCQGSLAFRAHSGLSAACSHPIPTICFLTRRHTPASSWLHVFVLLACLPWCPSPPGVSSAYLFEVLRGSELLPRGLRWALVAHCLVPSTRAGAAHKAGVRSGLPFHFAWLLLNGLFSRLVVEED